MSAFKDYYLPKVEEELGRKVTEEEITVAKYLYTRGWHPFRTANYLVKNKNRVFSEIDLLDE